MNLIQQTKNQLAATRFANTIIKKEIIGVLCGWGESVGDVRLSAVNKGTCTSQMLYTKL